MRKFLFGISFLALAATAADAWAHGFSLSLAGSQITPSSEAPLDGYPDLNIFYDQFGDPNPDGSIGSIEGFAFGDFSFGTPGTPTFTFDIVSPLLYSNGGAAVPAFVDPSHTDHGSSPDPSDQSTYVEIYDRLQASPTIYLYGNDPSLGGFDVKGTDPHELQKLLFNYSQGDGVYGFAFTFTASYPGGLTVTSPPLLDTWATADFTGAPVGQQTDAVLAIYNAAIPVPEPSGAAFRNRGSVLRGLAAAPASRPSPSLTRASTT